MNKASLFFLMFVCGFGKVFAAPPDSLIQKDEYNKDGFSVIFLLTDDTTFYQKWALPETPHISTQDTFKRGQTALPIIIFATDGKDDKGNANLTCDLTVTKPDGSMYAHFDGLTIWKDEPAPVMELSWSKIDIALEHNDPLGVYRVHATVHENNKKVNVNLNLAFLVNG